mgnify:FL=1
MVHGSNFFGANGRLSTIKHLLERLIQATTAEGVGSSKEVIVCKGKRKTRAVELYMIALAALRTLMMECHGVS